MSESLSLKLSSEEAKTFRELEEVVEVGQRTFIEVGNALYKIRESRLYREEFTSFESYLKIRWSRISGALGKRQAYMLINAAESQEAIAACGEDLPALPSERAARPLNAVPKEDKARVYKDAVELAKKNGRAAPTYREVTDAVNAYKGHVPETMKVSNAKVKTSLIFVDPDTLEMDDKTERFYMTLVQPAIPERNLKAKRHKNISLRWEALEKAASQQGYKLTFEKVIENNAFAQEEN